VTYLIIGGKGMLGRAFSELFAREGRSAQILDLPEFNLLSPEHVDSALRGDVSAVLNCAAYTNVDLAEQQEDAANKLNGEAVELLAKACAKRAVPLVHYSTDYVFAGNATEPYPVDGPHAPLNAYGRSKAIGERALWEAKGPHLLLRTSWLYAPWANNFVRTIFKASTQRPLLRVVDDQRGRPSSAEQVARVSLQLLDQKAHGTLHVTDGGQCSWHEFASEIVRLAGHDCQVVPCTAEEFARPAKRPAYSVMDLGPTEALVGAMPDWRENLADVMRRLEPVV
jgi:dTDP-4-dehydrorhamnose reductase